MEMRHNQNMQMLFDEEEEERQQQLVMMQQQQQQQQHMGGDPQQDATKNSYRVSRLNRTITLLPYSNDLYSVSQ